MTFLDLNLMPQGWSDAPDVAASADVATGARQPADPLTELEQRVIAISRRDPRASIIAPGRVRKLVNYIFWQQPPNALANPRLEALRRFSVMLRKQRSRLPLEETRRLRRAGFSPMAIDEARTLIEREFNIR